MAGVDEGMDGASTRFAFKVLSTTFNHDVEEDSGRSGASDVALELAIIREHILAETEKTVHRLHQE